MYFPKSPQGSKSAITMRPVSIESTLLLFMLLNLALIIYRSVCVPLTKISF